VKDLRGGYIGVDVFFVISGYLITQFIEQRIKAGKFSILEFYERRVRRIVPALFFLLIAASVVSCFVLLPQDLVKFAKSQIATVFFMPNLYFYYRGSGYFEAGTNLKPLQHMWSLGVEEQFYIFFPLIMLVVARLKRRAKLTVICLVCVASFALSCWMVQYRGNPSEAFYLLPYRAWELLLGSLLALGVFRLPESGYLRNILAGAGLCAIVVSALAYSSATPFPGLAAALPCIGAALIIYAGESGPTLIGRALSVRPVVAMGLISYSLYLWHWPVIVFAREFIGRPLTSIEKALTVLLSVIAAAVSWRWVERPFRRLNFGATRSRLFSQAAVGAGCLLATATLYIAVHGWPRRFPKQVIAYADGVYDWDADWECPTSVQIERQPQCHLGTESRLPPDYILWGDSHAKSLAPTFRRLAKETGSRGWMAIYPACMPLLDVSRMDKPGCEKFNADVISIIEHYDIKTIVLSGRWSVGALGLSENELDDGRVQPLLFDSSSNTRSLAENPRAFERGLRRTVARLAAEGRKVILVMDVPDTGVNTPQYLARALLQGRIAAAPEDTRIGMSVYGKDSVAAVDHLLLNLADEFHAVTIDPKEQLCEGFQCLVARDGHSLYRDSNHLSNFGALLLVDQFRAILPSTVDSHIADGSRPGTPKPRTVQNLF
jgi:peptidoglycan/LPS O-acetylase OafA/YrhL